MLKILQVPIKVLRHSKAMRLRKAAAEYLRKAHAWAVEAETEHGDPLASYYHQYCSNAARGLQARANQLEPLPE